MSGIGRRVGALVLPLGLMTALAVTACAADEAARRPAGRFRGRVINPDGQPIRGARIFVAPDARGHRELKHRVETDADGRFEFDAPDMTQMGGDGVPVTRPGTLFATAEGFAADWIRIRVSARANDPAELELQLAHDTPLRGQFLDSEGRPLADARVRVTQVLIPPGRDLNAHLLRESNSSALGCSPSYERSLTNPLALPRMMLEGRTDAEGRFELSGLGRDRLVGLEISAPTVVVTHLTAVTRTIPNVETRLDFNGQPTNVIHGSGFSVRLKAGLTVRGLVRDRETHAPLPGMWVGLHSGDSPLDGLSKGEYHRTTDAHGRFTITGLDPQSLEWNASARQIVAVAARGMPYCTAVAEFDRQGQVVIECVRGIPFRLVLKDEQGQPVPAKVTYRRVQPNPYRLEHVHLHDSRWPISRAARQSDGTYDGYVLPGPGAVLVETDPSLKFRPAHVDPKAFFAPGRTDWTEQERASAYGTHDTLSEGGAWINQHDYTGIVLVNPRPDEKPLELSATVARDRPRQVSLVDSQGQPVIGVRPRGLTFHPWDSEPALRTASFSLSGLHPDRSQRITFLHEPAKLIGFLMARGDSDAPYTVKMQPWATITGRIVDEFGKPLPAKSKVLLSLGDTPLVTHPDPEVGVHPTLSTAAGGTFQIDKAVPGLRYTARIYRKPGDYAGLAFKDLVLKPGETRALGDIRIQGAIDLLATNGKTRPGIRD